MKTISTLLLFVFYSLSACAGEVKFVDIPFIFDNESMKVKTSACIRVQEKEYNDENSEWEKFKASEISDVEKALVTALSAISEQNLEKFKAINHPDSTKNLEHFNHQATAYFEQFPHIEIDKILRYYAISVR